MRKTRQRVHRLSTDQRGSKRSGQSIFVADRGAVLFEIPRSWIVVPGPDCIEILDRAPPDSRCRLAVSYLRLPECDWSALPLARLLVDGLEESEVETIARSPVIATARPGLELAWTELRFVDLNELRQARSRLCLARGSDIQCLIVLDFWPEDEVSVNPVWDSVLGSLALDVQIQDLSGPKESSPPRS